MSMKKVMDEDIKLHPKVLHQNELVLLMTEEEYDAFQKRGEVGEDAPKVQKP